MPVRGTLTPTAPTGPDELTSTMVGIGMKLAAPAAPEPNIEDTLLFASIDAMYGDDLRVLAVLVTWFGVHAPWVNADRLTKIVAGQKSDRVRALWSAIGRWQARDRRFARLARVYTGERIDLLATGTKPTPRSRPRPSRKTYGSFATAWHVRRDFALLA